MFRISPFITFAINKVCVEVSIFSLTSQIKYPQASFIIGKSSLNVCSITANLSKSFPLLKPNVPIANGFDFSERIDTANFLFSFIQEFVKLSLLTLNAIEGGIEPFE